MAAKTRPHTDVVLGPADDRELLVLLDCARASIEPERAERLRERVAAGLNWDRLLTLAQRNGLGPLLYYHLNRTCALEGTSVPSAPFAFLRDYFQKNSAFGMLLTGELTRLLERLKAHGIDAVAFKGPAIAVKLYGHVALRQFCDLDILVRACDVWKASEVIAAYGFEPDYVIPPARRDAFVRQEYVQLFRRDRGRTLVELHWGVAPHAFAARFDAEAMWPRLEPMSLQGATVLVPSDEDLLLMLCLHGSRHGWDKLEGLSGVAELMRRNLDWDRLWQASRAMHCQRMLAFALLLAHGLFDVPVPAPFAAMSQSAELRAMTDGVVRDFYLDEAQSRTFARQTALHLRLKDTHLDQVRYCVRTALMTTPDDWAALRLPGSLSFAYPLVRAVRLARKYAFNEEKAAA